jgi:hypothetical protein
LLDYLHLFDLYSATTAIQHSSFDLIILSTLHQTMVFAVLHHSNLRLSLSESFIFCLILFQALLLSRSSLFKFSKAERKIFQSDYGD